MEKAMYETQGSFGKVAGRSQGNTPSRISGKGSSGSLHRTDKSVQMTNYSKNDLAVQTSQILDIVQDQKCSLAPTMQTISLQANVDSQDEFRKRK